jgi:hypothetical protein
MSKIPVCPINARRIAEINSGSPLTQQERAAYHDWCALRRKIKAAAGKKGAKKRWRNPAGEAAR